MIQGYGLHTGVKSEVRFFIEEGPVRFVRNGVSIEASVANVINTQRCTVLAKNNQQIALVEHLLAALHVKSWWRNLVIEVSDQELPILDGSAQGWLEAIEDLGEHPDIPDAYTINQNFRHEKGQSYIAAAQGETKLTASIEFEHPAIGKQSWQGSPESYADLLNARTFGFLSELEYLRSQGLASQASLENAIVFDESGALQPLRHQNEPVRHKALDALGDFFLLGQPIRANITIMRGSHELHTHFIRKLAKGKAL